MRVALFGASGATGLLLTERCLAAGHTVTALLRTPESFPYKDKVTVVQGSPVDDDAAIARTLVGAEAVLSALGARSLKKEDILERAVPRIVAAMERTGPRRLIVLGSSGALADSLKKQPAWRRWMVEKLLYPTVLKYPVASQVSQYGTLAGSGLDWTMVMPPMLTNGAARGGVRVDAEALPRNGSSISRADVADFMMAQLVPGGLRGGVYITW